MSDEELTQEGETRATILGLCNWLEAAALLLPHAPPNNQDTLSFVANLRGAVDAARSLVGDKEGEERKVSDFVKEVALAITRSSGAAGQAYDAEDPQGAEQRAENLTNPVGEYGAYIVEGDPYGWSEGALATILMEQKGTKGDCIVPLNYYGDGMTVSHLASSRIKGGYIEFVNAAVAVVHKS